MEEEIWKDIEGYEGLYQVSNLGRIKTLSKNINGRLIKEAILVLSKKNNAYYKVNLSKDGHMVTFCVHRLVAKAFLPNPNNLSQVGHKDENGFNNNINNLEWVSPKENCNMPIHRERISSSLKGKEPWNKGISMWSEEEKQQMSINRKGTRLGKENKSSKPVICANIIYNCIEECAKAYNIKSATMRKWLRTNHIPNDFILLGLSYYEED